MNGTRDEDDPAVGRVTIGNYNCSGTLVAPNVVLTAKHCFKRGTRPSQVKFLTGPDGDQEAAGVVAFTYQGKLTGKVTAKDILALTLDRDIPITPVTVWRDPMSQDDVGSSVRLVGYGVTDPSDTSDAMRRQGDAEIVEVGTEYFVTEGDATNCFGDSGGPVFVDDVMVGVISATYDDECNRRGSHTRVDRNVALIDRAKAKGTTGHRAEADVEDPQRDGVVTSGGGDDSCEWANDGICDEPEYCDPGTDATDCASASPDDSTCSCDADCPPEMRCDLTGNCGGGIDPAAIPDGDSCTFLPGSNTPEVPCRGFCVRPDLDSPEQGICASAINLAVTSTCPNETLRIVGGDDLAVCMLRHYATDDDCTAPLACRPTVNGSLCQYP